MNISKLKVLIICDNRTVKEHFKKCLIDTNVSFTFYYANNGKDAINKVNIQFFDLIFIDINLNDINCFKLLNFLNNSFKQTRLIIIADKYEITSIKRAYFNGVHAYILKKINKENLFNAIDVVHNGYKFFDIEVSNLLFEDLFSKSKNQYQYIKNELLSKREVQIISYLCRGLNNDFIATDLNLSIRTIEGHRYVIMKKLGFKKISELISYGIDHGF